MGHGPFAIVPTQLLTSDNAADFLPIALNLRKRAKTIQHELDSEFSIVARTNDWDSSDETACHEIEPMIVETLRNHGLTVAAMQLSSRLYIVIAESGKLLFANRFEAKTDQDTLYFVLAAYHHLELDTKAVPLTLSGQVRPELFRKYISKVSTSK